MEEQHWLPIVEIATDPGIDVSRFETYEKWEAATKFVEDSIRAVANDE